MPDKAKFNRPDPQRDWDWLRPHTLNLYEYCANDPVNNWDPNGLEWNNESGSIFLTIFETYEDNPEKLAQVESAFIKGQKEAGKIAVEMAADTYGDAFELVTGTTITGDPGNRGMAAAAIVVPFASSTTLKGVGNLVEKAAVAKLGKFEVGAYDDLRKSAETGLDAHHSGQKAVMKDLVENYDPKTAPSILVPKEGHTIKHPERGIVSRKTTGFENARDVVARDIKELKRVYPDIPNEKLKKLVEKNKTMYPEVRTKKNE